MKPFTFALEPVLQARRAAEIEKQQAFSARQQDLNRAQRRLRELDALITAVHAEIARRTPEVERARNEFEIAMQARKALELLKERQLAQYVALRARKEEAELDEANSA